MSTTAPSTAQPGRSKDARRIELLQAGLDLIDQGFTLIDENLQLVAWNDTFLRLLEFPPEMGYQGAPFESFMRYNAQRGEYGPGDIEAQVHERVAAAKAFRVHDIERTRPNGTVLRVRGVPVPDKGFVTLYSDVTQQRHSEKLIREQNAHLESRVAERTAELQATNTQLREALRLNEQFASSLERSEGQMRLITDSIPALVAYFDASLTYRYINRGYRDWFGLDPSRPDRVSAREFLGLDTYSLIKPYIKQALRGEPVTFEYEVGTVGGVKKLARTSLIPEVTDDRRVVGCFELTFDITQERRAHDILVQAQKMEALGQLTSGLSHDFNNILTVILGNLTALCAHADVRHHTDEYIAPAVDAARRGSDLIKGLLAFSRQQPMQRSAVEVDACLRSLDKLVRHTLPAGLELVFQPDAPGVHALLDGNQLQNALLNLVLNAKDATEGKGRIVVKSQTHGLDAEQATHLNLRPGLYACLSVQDDGCGMDAATRSRVFEPFFTTKQVGQGSGLGLSMVYGFARQSGGAVTIDSEPGLGTTFTLWLPVPPEWRPNEVQEDVTDGVTDGRADVASDGTPAANPPPCGPQQDALPQELALLVEDDAGVRKVVRRHLLDLGYAVLEAANGQEALGILAQTPGLHVVLSDFVMPGGVDGQQVTAQARQRGDIAKVLLMSGYPPDTRHPTEIPLIQKPFTREQLAAALQACLL